MCCSRSNNANELELSCKAIIHQAIITNEMAFFLLDGETSYSPDVCKPPGSNCSLELFAFVARRVIENYSADL